MLGYNWAVMRRVSNIMRVVFWASVPLFAVYVAVSWALGTYPFGWLGRLLWVVVLASAACLTPSSAFPSVSDGGVRSDARSSEWLVYPTTFLLLAALPFASQVF